MKSIVYATDFSKASVAALHCAQALSRLLHMRLVVTHVYDVPNVLGIEMDAPFPDIHADAHGQEREKLTDFYETHKSGDPAPDELRIEPVENMSVLSGIISKATEWNARLVVVGMKGESPLKEIIIGSTTKKLIDKAPCPVLAIPANHRFEDIQSLVYATDFELEDLRALEKVVALAEVFGAEVRVVHVTNDKEFSGASQMEWFKAMAEERIQYDKVFYELVESKDVAHSLQNYTQHLNAGLIGMLERSQKEGVKKWFRRDLVKQMASNSSIPLLSFNEQNLQTLFF
jgi:nucleotide-binding universal stress UspA family protein